MVVIAEEGASSSDDEPTQSASAPISAGALRAMDKALPSVLLEKSEFDAYQQRCEGLVPAPPAAGSSVADGVAFATRYKEAGSVLLKEGSPRFAARAYCKAIRELCKGWYEADPHELFFDFRAHAVLCACWANAALALTKAGAPAEAVAVIDAASKAVSVNSSLKAKRCPALAADQAKLCYRRASARLALGDDERAADDFEQALRHEPGNTTVANELKRLRQRQAKARKAAQAELFGGGGLKAGFGAALRDEPPL